MNNETVFRQRLDALRRKAEEQLAGSEAAQWEADVQPHRLLHELHVHQIELEMQNEDLRETQHSLERSRDRYLELYHQAPLGYVVADSAGMILQANQTFSHMLDEALADLVHRPLSDLIHPPDRSVFFSRFRAFHKDPTDKRLEVRLKKDRTLVDVKLEGRRIQESALLSEQYDRNDLLFITISDIRRRKAAEKAIIRAKSQWEQTFDAVPDLIAIIDEQAAVVRVNQALATRLGVTPAACVGKSYEELFYNDQGAPTDCPYRRMRESGRLIQTEAFNRTLNGHFITTATPFNNDHLQAGWCILVLNDISDRKQAEKELLKLRNLESIGTLAGGIAHDFNNILTSLVGNIELAKLNCHNAQKALSHLDQAIESAFRARNLANRLLTFSTGGSPRNQPVEIDRLVQEVIQTTLNGTNVDYDLQLSGYATPMVLDAAQLRSALGNIIANALEAMPRGGRMKIRSSRVDLAQHDDGMMAPGPYVRIDIADDGVGIRSEHLDKIFDPYFTTKQMGAQKGMGLGLAISHSIIKKHQGYISVDSVEAQGTTVTIHLPLHPQPTAPPPGKACGPARRCRR